MYLFLERGEGMKKERERDIDVWEKHQSVASCTRPDQDQAATQACALTGNRTSDLLLCGECPTKCTTPVSLYPFWSLKFSMVKG